MSTTSMAYPQINLFGKHEPDHTSPRFVSITALVEGGHTFKLRIDPTDRTSRKVYLNRLFRSLAAKGIPGPGPAGRAAVERQILYVARTALPPELAVPKVRRQIARVVRPHLFFTPWVAGVAISRRSSPMTWCEPHTRLHLQWADGRRQITRLRSRLRLPDGRFLLLEPQWVPPAPDLGLGAGMAAGGAVGGGWPAEAREAWCDGRPAPQPLDVFRRVLALITEYVDFDARAKAHPPANARAAHPSGEAPASRELPPSPEAAPIQGSPTAVTLALWTMLTYTYPAWSAVPYLSIIGPPESGKTTLLGVLSGLCFHPLVRSCFTGSSSVELLRALKCRAGTLLLDQADGLAQGGGGAKLRGIHHILLAGYKRGATITLMDATVAEEVVDIFSPKAFVCAGGLAPELARRCIPIHLTPAPPTSACPGRTIEPDDQRWSQLTGDLHALALACGQTWLSLAGRPPGNDVMPTMGWRQRELWQPLLALAAWLEENGAAGLLELAAAHARACSAVADQERIPDVGELLLRALAQRVMAGEAPTCGDLLAAAREEDPAVARLLHGSPRAVAVALGRYGLSSTRAKDRRYRLCEEDLRRVEEVYGVDLEICGAASEICGAI